MTVDRLTDAEIARILLAVRRIALVGASARPERPSNRVLAFLLTHGYDVVPVNPGLAGQSLHGRRVAGNLAEAAPLEMVELFRAPGHVRPAVHEAIQLGARVIWMQLGVIEESAAEVARAAGLTVVMDRCPKIEWGRLGLTRAAAAPGPAGDGAGAAIRPGNMEQEP